jgi:hypothetical protein
MFLYVFFKYILVAPGLYKEEQPLYFGFACTDLLYKDMSSGDYFAIFQCGRALCSDQDFFVDSVKCRHQSDKLLECYVAI